MAEETEKTMEVTEQVNASISKQPGLRVVTKTLRGDWEGLSKCAKAAKVGRNFDSSSDPGFEGLEGKISSVQCVRVPGGLADYTVSTSEFEDVVVLELDFMEVQKPIRSWHYDAEGDKKPDLTKLRAWERLDGNTATQADYDAYRTGPASESSSETLSGATLTLAKMIREEGIESYAVYTPVLTKTSRLADLSKIEKLGDKIGQIDTPSASETVGEIDGGKLTGVAKQWLKTADRLQGALDGTFTRTETWTGADKWNANLYGSSSTSSASSK